LAQVFSQAVIEKPGVAIFTCDDVAICFEGVYVECVCMCVCVCVCVCVCNHAPDAPTVKEHDSITHD
jgi:hypothetical protein